MKKWVITSLVVVLILLLTSFLSITIYKNYNSKIDIETSNESWLIFDASLNNIKNNMDPITNPSANFIWWELKDFNIDDETYKNSLNSLVADVRMCYLYHSDDGVLYTNTNLMELKKYRDKKEITAKELQELNSYMLVGSCLDNMDNYQTLLIANNKENSDKFNSKINDIITIYNTNIFQDKNASYDELLTRLIIEVKIVEDLSDFIKNEYERLK